MHGLQMGLKTGARTSCVQSFVHVCLDTTYTPTSACPCTGVCGGTASIQLLVHVGKGDSIRTNELYHACVYTATSYLHKNVPVYVYMHIDKYTIYV